MIFLVNNVSAKHFLIITHYFAIAQNEKSRKNFIT